MANVLVVDDDRELCAWLGELLGERGHSAKCVGSGEAALQAAAEGHPDLVLLDLVLEGDMDGYEVLRGLRALEARLPIVMMTAHGNVAAAVLAMKLGAADFVEKPLDGAALLGGLEELLSLRREPSIEVGPVLVGESPAFRRAMDLVLRFAVPEINVLLLGETGTGKELFARAIHAASKRRRGPFVPLDCAMLAESLVESELFGHEKGAFTGAICRRLGRLELAQGGTLFLDEIGNLPPELQAKLLRFLQERRMERVGGRESVALDVRVVSATNADIKEAIRAGRFRQDLYFRLKEVAIRLPPLREREGDAARLAEHFVAHYAARFGFGPRWLSAEAMELVNAYGWPGNVRELENAMKAAVVLAPGAVCAEHLPPEVRGVAAPSGGAPDGDAGAERPRLAIDLDPAAAGTDLKAVAAHAAEQAERFLLAALVRRGGMTGRQMAVLLGIDPKTLRAKLRRYGLGSAPPDVTD
ncbi:MAG: sigma-54-dependent Fis family transcriptional regulator [Deltaproteobacteria bacterium]|nr:sigma-54-dependent Fis family transcriptional regulator [Deltaproteobacteria bacterium]